MTFNKFSLLFLLSAPYLLSREFFLFFGHSLQNLANKFPTPHKHTFFHHLVRFVTNFLLKIYPTPYKRTFFCCLVRFVTNFLLKNFSPLYKGTFFAYLACIFDFFHKDFILPSLLYSQTLFCHLAHFLRNFRKKIIPYHISERFSAIWSVFHELSAKKYLYP